MLRLLACSRLTIILVETKLMKIDPKIQYKSETGKSAYFEAEADRHTLELDSVMLEGMTGKEIRSLIDYDCKHNVKLGVFLDVFPDD